MTGLGVAAPLRELIELRRRVPAAVTPWPGRPGRIALPGRHAALGRGRGVEFAEARPYQAGDDVRAVDWRQTARRGRLYTKLFQEERERPVYLLADLGPSMRFGTRVAFKSVVAARAAAWLAWAAAAGGDRVGGLVWDGARERDVPPQGLERGVLNLLRCLSDVSSAPPAARARGLAAPLHGLARSLRPESQVILISDFAGLDAETTRQILALAQSAELKLIHVYDLLEAEAPPPGCYPVTDGNRRQTLDLRSAPSRAAYGAAFAAHREALERLAQRASARLLPLATHADPAAELHRALANPPGMQRTVGPRAP